MGWGMGVVIGGVKIGGGIGDMGLIRKLWAVFYQVCFKIFRKLYSQDN